MKQLQPYTAAVSGPNVIDLREVMAVARNPFGLPATARAAAPTSAWGRASRSYAGAAYGRATADWVTLSTSADAELYTSLRVMRNRCRQLVRDNEHARQAQRLITNNVVGQGIGLQAEVPMRRGVKLDDRTNANIEDAWAQWGRARSCHTAGRLSWAAMQRQIINAMPESGEILLRKVKQRFGGSRIPFAIEVIEVDQLVDNFSGRAPNGNQVRMGVEVDEWLRPVAYWLYPRHPGDIMQQGVPQSNEYRRVPAEEIIHVGIFDRPNQTRCVPWLHAAMTKLRHIGGAEEAEIVRARASAAIMGFIKTPEVDVPGDDEGEGADGIMDGERVWDMAPGTIRTLGPGEEFNGFNPSAPNAALDPFLRYMLRCVASGIGLSYESLSRDYSQSNYSSSRLALLDDRDQWRVLQQWFIETVHVEVFEAWLEMAVLSGELDLPAYETVPQIYQAVRWQPRGWDWVDPAREVAAYKAAVRAGFQTTQDVVGMKGGVFADKLAQRAREIEQTAEKGLVFDTDPAQVNDKGAAQAFTTSREGGDNDSSVDAVVADDQKEEKSDE